MVEGRYTRVAMLFHWLVAAGIFANVALAWTWPYLGDEKLMKKNEDTTIYRLTLEE